MGENSFKLHEKVTEESDKLFKLFEDQKWRELSNLMGSFEDVSSAKDVVRQVHPLLAQRDPVTYSGWLETTRADVSALPDKSIKNLVSRLVDSKQYKRIIELSKSLKGQNRNIGYSYLDACFAGLK